VAIPGIPSMPAAVRQSRWCARPLACAAMPRCGKDRGVISSISRLLPP
jgi:hypothetical protein